MNSKIKQKIVIIKYRQNEILKYWEVINVCTEFHSSKVIVKVINLYFIAIKTFKKNIYKQHALKQQLAAPYILTFNFHA